MGPTNTANANEVFPLQPSLGANIRLGQLYDVRSQQFFGGLSLWKDSEVNPVEQVDDKKIQNADYKFTYSLDEARTENSLNVEGSLALDLKMLSAEGSAKYLNEKKSSNHEARLNVSCVIERRTRRIPMEVLSQMTYEKILDNPQYTHFVAEVVEGASATLTFVRSCSSDEEAKEITGELKVKIVSVPVSGSAKVEWKEGVKKLMENVKISYSGAIAENVTTFEDAMRVANEMPTKLAQQMNTLKYKLLPLSLLDSRANRLIRSIDTGLVIKTAESLQAGNNAILALKDVAADDMFQKSFPTIKKQISNFQSAFSVAETDFTSRVRQLLPELRDGNTNGNEKIAALQQAVGLYQRQTNLLQQFIAAKSGEAKVLRPTVDQLLKDNFENHLGQPAPGLNGSLVDDAPPRLFLSVGGGSLGAPKHELQKSLEQASSGDAAEPTEDEEIPIEEWYENQQTRTSLKQSCEDLRQQRKLATAGVKVVFGVASISMAYRNEKKVRTSIGDILLEQRGKLVIVTGMLPRAPAAPKISVTGQTFTVTWSSDREVESESAMPTDSFVIRYRRVLNPNKDGPFPRAIEDELFKEVHCAASVTSQSLADLSDDCDYEVGLSFRTWVGASPWSRSTVERTEKRSTEARNIIEFFGKNKAMLTASPKNPGDKAWDYDSNRKAIFLGHTEFLRRPTTVAAFGDEIAVRIVDVAMEYKEQVAMPPLKDMNKTIVTVFTGASGAGKSTQINAFVSYLLGGEVDDPARLLLIDDRAAKQAESVTQLVTCFRIRPLAPAFEGKTFLIVDTPGYGDSRGVKRDNFVTAAMSQFFDTVSHVNSIVFVCKANEIRTTLLQPVATYVFSLFAKDVQNCLRTVYTFSDGGLAQAHNTLQQLKWPVQNGEVAVDNSAFTLDLKGGDITSKIRGQWIESIRGQFILQAMLIKMTPVPTKGSAEVTRKRMKLEEQCALAERKIHGTASAAQYIIAQISTLAAAIGKAPDAKILHKYIKTSQKPVAPGTYTTLCLICNATCHEVCAYSDDKDKVNCSAMTNEYCTMCPKKCKWDQHRNASFIISGDEVTEEITPQELLDSWNKGNNTQEGVLIGLLNDYLDQQKILRQDMMNLVTLNDQLKESALLHDSEGLINYVDMLIATAGSQGAEYVAQLKTARKTLQLLIELKNKDKNIGQDLVILVDVLDEVRKEMQRRMALSTTARVAEEKKPSSLYNTLRAKLPQDLMNKAPPELKTESSSGKGALYEENLKAVVKLMIMVLKDGGVVAAVAANSA